MIIAIPIEEDKGLDSLVCAHFGSAPGFLIVDAESGLSRAVGNQNHQHVHGACTPLASLQGERLDGIVVGGIGGGALAKLNAAGLDVFLAAAPTVRETIEALKAGTLQKVEPGMACGHHGHDHGAGPAQGCGHGRT
ncbi:MAG: diguanylate cyclase [Candidatus Aminicenantes bacterium]|nr:diguanylate cyclase [Candidatus Aminicenantes bacterium]